MAEQKFGELNDTQKSSLQQLDRNAQTEINTIYGTGFPLYAGGEGLWFYHNGNHNEFVGDGTQKVLAIKNLSPDIQAVGRYAGIRHDRFQGKGHEALGAALAEEELRRESLPEWAAVMASLAIAGTEVIMKKGIIVAQKASLQVYSSKEAETMALGMASADMGVLFQPSGPLYMHDYYRELRSEAEPTIGEDFLTFKDGQMCMLDAYKYPLQGAEAIFATHKVAVMEYHQKIYQQVQSGEISTWAQLRASDLAFAQSLM